ncbi:MAG: DUF2118 domain-containing protein [Acidilobaceae archaeon]|nr:DUF2118 domain-containing protein [Acidilobaceae archaeon]MCX8165817.1 DUF2118 domain-containing protein [Acidilobaceae archaeon]MDW7974241.1 DUF2118 domain-containing protein [Sulfolobales archaeon]
MESAEDEYALPELYLEEAAGEPCASVDLERKTFEIGKGELCKILYEDGWERAISPEGKALKSFLVVRNKEGVFVKGGSALRLFEVKGSAMRLIAREGERVERGETIAQLVSRKGELRSVKSDTEGVVVYIAWLPGKPEKYVYVISETAHLLTRVG